jgi:integrase
MTERDRRPRSEAGVYWNESRQRFVAEETVGYDARGKRVRLSASGTSESAALRALRRRVRDYEAGLVKDAERYLVKQAVEDWLKHGQAKAGDATRTRNRNLSEIHVIPSLGGRRLRDLRADEVDTWLAGLSTSLSTSTLRQVRSCLNRAVRRAMKRNLVDRNVVELCDVPRGRDGRRSKSLTLDQARHVLTLTNNDALHCYIVLSLLTGARTEELRALRWEHVHLDGGTRAGVALPAYVEVWRSVRAGGDTKTRKSRRTLALPTLAVAKLREHRSRQAQARLRAESWADDGVVFATAAGTEMDAANVRRDFRRALKAVPGLDPAEWTPRELRHSFVSLLSEWGLAIEDISRLVGHSGTHVTELVYRHELRPVIQTGATAMDSLFATGTEEGE